MDTYQCVLDYADHGYCVIPTIPGTRKTPVKWKEFQSRRPTYEELEKWFGVGHDHGWDLAVVCGAISSVVVVDADSDDAVKYLRLMLPPTPMVVCTNKGQHWYYRHPGHHVQSKPRIIDDPPIDIRADGGLAQGYGSKHHVTGKLYVLADGCDIHSPSELPLFQSIWFPQKDLPQVVIQHREISGDAMERAARYLAKIPNAGSGTRNQTAYRVAAILIRDFGLDISSAESLLGQWNMHNDPPLPDYELKVIAKSAEATARNPIGAKL